MVLKFKISYKGRNIKLFRQWKRIALLLLLHYYYRILGCKNNCNTLSPDYRIYPGKFAAVHLYIYYIIMTYYTSVGYGLGKWTRVRPRTIALEFLRFLGAASATIDFSPYGQVAPASLLVCVEHVCFLCVGRGARHSIGKKRFYTLIACHRFSSRQSVSAVWRW